MLECYGGSFHRLLESDQSAGQVTAFIPYDEVSCGMEEAGVAWIEEHTSLSIQMYCSIHQTDLYIIDHVYIDKQHQRYGLCGRVMDMSRSLLEVALD
jgi:hypothetical protein